MLAQRRLADAAAELIVVVGTDSFPHRILSIEIQDALDTLGVILHSVFGARGVTKKHITCLHTANVGLRLQRFDPLRKRFKRLQ